MGTKQLQIEGQTHEIDEEVTGAELKDEFGASPNDMVTFYYAGDGTRGAMSDRDSLETVPDGARLAFQPDGTIFGAVK